MEEAEEKGQKRKAESESEAAPASKAAKTDEKYTIFVGGLKYEATEEDIKKHFESCGEIVEVRLRMDNNATNKNKGFCHIDFATKEGKEAALKLSETEFMGRSIRCDSADGNDRRRNKDENYSPRSNKVFVANLNHDYDEEAHRNALKEHFEKFGTIVGDIRLPYNRETGALKGIAYVSFETPEQAEAAVKGMNGVEVNGRPLRTDFSDSNDRERVARNKSGRGGRGGFRGGFRGSRGGRGGRGGFRGANKA
ncbi:uncharacterized protein BX663DRAFT_492468 [Cokeromyces recurvatus]|uniref:uncharacterized protein n=1 Tax=Cokeromyces recurvatus TaxID=90255 RepID=UPI00221F1A8D|nr:uncharacterized protein BX663DRAFT_492468 [Cokeromyces recurvatus]KAI7907931.1 hypothetical protein BX663DRAFT_492468 [Cokeromyces recurvatus]